MIHISQNYDFPYSINTNLPYSYSMTEEDFKFEDLKCVKFIEGLINKNISPQYKGEGRGVARPEPNP